MSESQLREKNLRNFLVSARKNQSCLASTPKRELKHQKVTQRVIVSSRKTFFEFN